MSGPLVRAGSLIPAQGSRRRLETLEARCLLSGWRHAVEPLRVVLESGRAPAISTARGPTRDPGDRDLAPPQARESARSAPGGDPDASDYPPAGSKGDANPSPGTHALQQVPYVIVPETASPHDTRGSAQRLPDLPFFGVIGAIAPGDATDYYRLAVSSITEAVDFALTSTQPGSAVPLQIQLFDGSGQSLGLWSSGGKAPRPYTSSWVCSRPGRRLHLGISATNPLGAEEASGAIDYQLWIGRSSAVDRSTAGLGGASPVSPTALAPITTLPLTTLSGSGVPAAPGASQAAPAPRDGTTRAACEGLSVRPRSNRPGHRRDSSPTATGRSTPGPI